MKKYSSLNGKEICGAQSPGDPNADDPDDMPITCTDEPGHEGKHIGGTRCGTLTWISETRWS